MTYQYGIREEGTSVIFTALFVGMFGFPAIVGLLIPYLQAESLMYTNLVAACIYLVLLIVIRCTNSPRAVTAARTPMK